MKKYFLGLTAIICAIAFSAFTKPYSLQAFTLDNKPTSSGSVTDGDAWKTDGLGGYATCQTTPQDIACTIELNSSTMSAFTHGTTGSERAINDVAFATAGGAHLDYVAIVESIGKSPDRTVSSLTFFHFANGNYVDVTANYTQGTDYKFTNAND